MILRIQYQPGVKAQTISDAATRSESLMQADMDRIHSTFLTDDLTALRFGNAIPKKANVRVSELKQDALELNYETSHSVRSSYRTRTVLVMICVNKPVYNMF